MRRIVRAGLIQASVGTGEPKALDRLKQFMIDKHVSLIEQAAAEGVRIPCLQELFNRRNAKRRALVVKFGSSFECVAFPTSY